MTNKQYELLKEKYSLDELADNIMIPKQITPKQKAEANTTLQQVLDKRRANLSPEYKLKAALLQLRFKIEDYLNDNKYDKRKTFGYFLKLYIDGLQIKRNEFAAAINIKPTELSLYINNHRIPPQYILIRLELHSHGLIPATNWYKLLEKVNLHELSTNKSLRTEERKYIKQEAQLVAML
jgi:hypothetical protein